MIANVIVRFPTHEIDLQDDLNSLHQWSQTWDLNFNAKKCATLRFSRKKTPIPPQDYSLNQQLKSSSTQGDFGYTGEGQFKMVPSHHQCRHKSKQNAGFFTAQLLSPNRRACLPPFIPVFGTLSLVVQVVKSGLHKVFNVALQSSFSRTTKRPMLIV